MKRLRALAVGAIGLVGLGIAVGLMAAWAVLWLLREMADLIEGLDAALKVADTGGPAERVDGAIPIRRGRRR